MRHTTVIIALLAVAADAHAQQSGTAGATRPKLQVLQALPEPQLFIMMNLVADSLGVRCDYCHVQSKPDLTKTPANVGGWVWDSDDTPAKKIARDMMKMVVDLNTKSFDGRSRVTCYTCHQGALDPSRTPPLPPLAWATTTTAAPAPLPPIDKVWTTYISAVGKATNQAPGTGTIISGWDDRSEGRYGRFEIVTSGDNRYRITLTNTDGSVIRQGFDADGAWAATNDRVARLTSPSDTSRMRAIAMRYWPVKERPANLQVVRIERVNGHDAYVARARIDPTTVRTMYFDINTGLLRREMITTDTLLIPLQEQVDYDDYRDVNGVQMPFHVQSSDGAPYDTITRIVMQIRRDVPVDDAMFKAPQ